MLKPFALISADTNPPAVLPKTCLARTNSSFSAACDDVGDCCSVLPFVAFGCVRLALFRAFSLALFGCRLSSSARKYATIAFAGVPASTSRSSMSKSIFISPPNFQKLPT